MNRRWVQLWQYLTSSEVISSSSSRATPRNLWNPKVHHRVDNIQPLIPFLSLRNPTSILFLKAIHLHIIHLSVSRSSKWSLPCRFLHHNPAFTCPLPIRAECTAHLLILDCPNHTCDSKYYEVTHYAILSCYFLPLMPKYLPWRPTSKHPQAMFFL